MSSDRPKLGAAFRTPPPDRTSGLAGLLSTTADAAEHADGAQQAAAERPTPSAGPEAGPTQPEATSSGEGAPEQTAPPTGEAPASASARRRTGQRRQNAPTAAEPAAAEPAAGVATRAERRIASIALDASVLADLRAFAARTEQTHGAVVLRAIEANAATLARHWASPEQTDPTVERLFAGTPAIRRRSEPVVQTQIRLMSADMDTLDQLVEKWAAPSRSALVNEALRLYLRTAKDAQ